MFPQRSCFRNGRRAPWFGGPARQIAVRDEEAVKHMAFAWTKSRYSPIAVDFGADSLKLLQIIPSDPPQIVTAASAEVPEQARLDPTARHAFFAESLKTLLKTQPFKGNKAICSLPAYQ